MIENAIRKIVRVEEVPRKPVVEARAEMLVANNIYRAADTLEAKGRALPPLMEKYNEYIKARIPPEEEVVVFDTFRIKLR